jgi:hypothetical protein
MSTQRTIASMPDNPLLAHTGWELWTVEESSISAIRDAAARYQRIAAWIICALQAGKKCWVASPGNDGRRTLNQEIGNVLVAHTIESKLRAESHQRQTGCASLPWCTDILTSKRRRS